MIVYIVMVENSGEGSHVDAAFSKKEMAQNHRDALVADRISEGPIERWGDSVQIFDGCGSVTFSIEEEILDRYVA